VSVVCDTYLREDLCFARQILNAFLRSIELL